MSNNGGRNKSVAIGDLVVTVKELTVGEIGQWLDDKLTPGDEMVQDPLLSLMPVGDMVLGDVMRMTDLTREHIDDMTGSELEQVSAVCKEVNTSFFGLAATLTLAGKAALDQHLKH
ncbi:MAG: hypothetical protein COB22_07875 [Cycloclasticus sp.]|nr:MAG: hypothetical protein COB22_07875 [Cycloclasticus sp.]